MSLKHLYSIICRESKIDADTNNLSIVDVYESLQFQAELHEDVHLTRKEGDPILLPFTFEITSAFYREAAEKRLEADTEVHVFDPNGKALGTFPAHMVLEKDMHRMRSRIRVQSIALTISGTYHFEVMLTEAGKTKKVGTVPLDITVEVK